MLPRFPRDSRLALLGVLALLLAARPAAAGSLGVLVPAYFYPSFLGSDWDRMDTAAGKIPLTAIMNPASGPGPSQNSDYVTAVNKLEAAGGRVVGYVYTSYGARPLADVEADVLSYKTFYNINGIFFDQQSTSNNPAVVDYYKQLYDYVKSLNPAYEVIGNPGTNPDPAYLSTPTADVEVTFENFAANYPAYAPALWMSGYSAGHFANIVHTEPTAAGMLADLQRAEQNNAGLVYVTNRTLPNPYDQLPSYWDQEVAAIELANAVPEPSGVMLLAAGALSLLGWRWARFTASKHAG
jgi:hypothetical protein